MSSLPYTSYLGSAIKPISFTAQLRTIAQDVGTASGGDSRKRIPPPFAATIFLAAQPM